MRGRMKFSLQTGLIILIFSFLLTAVFTFSMLWFSNPSMPVVTDSAGIYLLSPVDYEQIIRDNGTLKLNSENYIGAADYRSAVTEAYFKPDSRFGYLFNRSIYYFGMSMADLKIRL